MRPWEPSFRRGEKLPSDARSSAACRHLPCRMLRMQPESQLLLSAVKLLAVLRSVDGQPSDNAGGARAQRYREGQFDGYGASPEGPAQ